MESPQVAQSVHSVTVPAGHFALLRVDAPASEVRISMLDEQQQAIAYVKPLYLRSAPLFFCMAPEPREAEKQLAIEVFNTTREFPVVLQTYVVKPDEAHSAQLLRGLQYLCSGVVENSSENPEDGTKQLLALEEAGELLQSSGQPELAQWAKYFHAYTLYAPLYDYRGAIEEADRLATGLDSSSQPLLALLTHQLLGQALLEQDERDTPEQSAEQLIRAHEEFHQAISLARQLGSRYEESWALNNIGVAHFYQDRPARSIESYESAIQAISETGDSFLISLYGQNVAVAQDRAGKTAEALSTLQKIHTQLAELKAVTYASLNLIEQGRLYSKLHLYPDAIRVLSEALAQEKALGGTESMGRIYLFIGTAYQQMGQLERSNEYLELAIVEMQKANYANGLRDAYWGMANNARAWGDYERVEQFRGLQGEHLSSGHNKAIWYYEKSYDASAQNNPATALEFTRLSMSAQEQSELDYLSKLGLLRTCVLQFQVAAQESCDLQEAQQAADFLAVSGNPRRKLEGQMLWAEVQSLVGNREQALVITTGLIEEISTYRDDLPGVLGSWYWDSRSDLFHLHMALELDRAKDDPSAAQALLALRRLQNVGSRVSGERETAVAKSPDSMRLRELLRELELAEAEDRKLALATEIDRIWLEKAGNAAAGFTSGPEQPAGDLLADVSDGSTLLVYYWSGTALHAWAGNTTGLQHWQLDVPADFEQLVQEAGRELRVVNSDRLDAYLNQLGKILVEPLLGALQRRILFLATGAVGSIPLEALRLNDRPLFEQFEVANLMSLDALSRDFAVPDKAAIPLSVFIAGDPQLQGDGLAPLEGAGEELQALQSILSDHAVHVSTQDGLTRDTFHSTQFREADIIHIASHGQVNRQWPELSQITLSSKGPGMEPDFLMPADLEAKSIQANLVVLSACNMAGENPFEFDTGLGFVSEFIQAGAASVVASQWPVADHLTAQFMQHFYTERLSGADDISALTGAKRAMKNAAQADGVYQQVAFQIYLR
jgi:CHAT domain-containing protein